MSNAVLKGQSRETSGKGVARKLRAQGLVPAVVYAKHMDKPLNVAIDPKDLRKAIQTPHRFNTLISLEIEGSGSHLVLLKDYQQNPLTRAVLHADFIGVREDTEVNVNVPLVLTGKAAGVADGGLLSQARRELEVWAMPRSIPEVIEVDVTSLKVNEAMHARDIKFPEGIRFESRVNYTIAVISVPEGAAEVKPAAAAAAPEPKKGGKK